MRRLLILIKNFISLQAITQCGVIKTKLIPSFVSIISFYKFNKANYPYIITVRFSRYHSLLEMTGFRYPSIIYLSYEIEDQLK